MCCYIAKTVSFHHHVFNFLFQNKGRNVKCKPGKLYEKSDFPSYFDQNFFLYYNKFGEDASLFCLFVCIAVFSSLLSWITNKKPLCCNFNEIHMLCFCNRFSYKPVKIACSHFWLISIFSDTCFPVLLVNYIIIFFFFSLSSSISLFVIVISRGVSLWLLEKWCCLLTSFFFSMPINY